MPSLFVAHAQKKAVDIPGFSANYSYEVETLGVGSDGTKALKVWSFDKSVDRAIVKAKKSAVAACIFKGLPASSNATATPPLYVGTDPEWNDYFNHLFADDGEYANYVNITTDGVPSGQDRLKTKGGYKVGIYVQVLYDDLRKKLEADGVIKSMNSWF